jgi:hypothetical protein
MLGRRNCVYRHVLVHRSQKHYVRKSVNALKCTYEVTPSTVLWVITAPMYRRAYGCSPIPTCTMQQSSTALLPQSQINRVHRLLAFYWYQNARFAEVAEQELSCKRSIPDGSQTFLPTSDSVNPPELCPVGMENACLLTNGRELKQYDGRLLVQERCLLQIRRKCLPRIIFGVAILRLVHSRSVSRFRCQYHHQVWP